MNDPDDPGGEIFVHIIFIALFIMIKAFFAAIEMALVSLDKNRISAFAQEGNRSAQLLQRLITDSSKLLAMIQVGITLTTIFSSALAATGTTTYFSKLLAGLPYSEEISIVVIMLILSYITLLFGELLPKRLAIKYAEQIAFISVRPILIVDKMLSPFVKMLSFSMFLLGKSVGWEEPKEPEKKGSSREEIRLLAQAGQADGTINAKEYEMINGVFELDNKIAREIMTPRTATFTLDVNTPPNQLADLLLNEKYSRIPVFRDDSDTIIGILHIKDFFVAARKVGFDQVDILPILREPYFVPETKYIDDLLRELQSTQNHMAIIIDEYGGFSGIVTIEDLLEEIVGEIDDEYDEIEEELVQLGENQFIASGKLSIDHFNERFNTNIDIPNIDTISGFILDQIGMIPDRNDQVSIEYHQIIFTVISVKDHRIDKIRIEDKRSVKKISDYPVTMKTKRLSF